MAFQDGKAMPRQQDFWASVAGCLSLCRVPGTGLQMILAWLMRPMWAATGPTPRHYLIPSEKELARAHAPLWLIYRFFFFED